MPNANLYSFQPWQVVGEALEEGSVPFEITITTDEEGQTLTVQDTVRQLGLQFPSLFFSPSFLPVVLGRRKVRAACWHCRGGECIRCPSHTRPFIDYTLPCCIPPRYPHFSHQYCHGRPNRRRRRDNHHHCHHHHDCIYLIMTQHQTVDLLAHENTRSVSFFYSRKSVQQTVQVDAWHTRLADRGTAVAHLAQTGHRFPQLIIWVFQGR